MHLLIIGGSDAGISAALRAHEIDPATDITLLLADDYPNFSICGLPYFLSGQTPHWQQLAHRTEFPGIRVLRGHIARSIDAVARRVHVEHAGALRPIPYDRLIVATGATPVRPSIPGSTLEGVYTLHTMDESFAIDRHITERSPRSAVIVGAGYIGLEMADALTRRGLQVTLLSRSPDVLPTVDAALARRVADELHRHGVRVVSGVSAQRIDPARASGTAFTLQVADSEGERHGADLVILAVGVRPASELAERAGAALGAHGAIAVTRQMQTNLPDVLAAGDCATTYHRLLDAPTYLSLGTIAHKQGRIAGERAVGGTCEFAGTVGSQSLKVFDLAIARTGLLGHEARDAGFDPLTVAIQADDHKAYFPGAVPLQLRITGDRRSGRLLGAQILGDRRAEVSKRIDIVAAALYQGASVEQLNELDLTYTPPFSSPWDPVQLAAQAWQAQRAARGRSV